MSPRPEWHRTADGSPTLYVPALRQHYHSIHGAQQESEHVFIRTGLEALPPLPHIQLLEVGFGTGLNALLTARQAQEQARSIHYTTLEKFPLEPASWQRLAYPRAAPPEWLPRLHEAPWEKDWPLHPHFTLHKRQGDLRGLSLPTARYHLIYFDAFAPEAQPELWTAALFSRLFHSLQGGGLLVTYCVKGSVRRALQAAGFAVAKLPGPPGKREITRAEKPRS